MSSTPTEPAYTYDAVVVRAIDGDTVVVDIDLGLSIFQLGTTLRLAGINAPELRGAERDAGKAAKAWLVDNVVGRSVILRTEKDRSEKYGRLLAHLYLHQGDGTTLYINDALVAAGHAKPAAY